MRANWDVAALRLDSRGMFGDRQYMWVEGEPHVHVRHHAGTVSGRGCQLTQREDPGLTGIEPTPVEDGVVLSQTAEIEQHRVGPPALFVPRRPDIPAHRVPVRVWSWEGEAVDQGDEAAAWGEAVLGRPCRLVEVSEATPRWVEGNPALGRVGFCDGYPLTVGSTTAFARLNKHLESVGWPPVPINRARASVILSGLDFGDGSCFPEDYVAAVSVPTEAGTLVLERRKACGRCPVPDTDQVSGERRTHVRSALGKLGRTGTHLDSGLFGTDPEIFLTQNFIVHLPPGVSDVRTADIVRGAEVEATLTETTNWVPVPR